MGARQRALAPLALAAALLACAKPPPDPDAQPAGAVPLALDQRHVDTLQCDENDCADWYRLDVPAKGLLMVDLGPGAPETPPGGLSARMLDDKGETLAIAASAHGESLELKAPVGAGPVLVEVTPADPKAAVGYALLGRFKPAPPPPPPPKAVAPRFETKRAAVLEVEDARSAQPSVLLEAGEAAGFRPGMRGVLVDGGKKLAQVVIVNVYPDGSRARVEGVLSGSISPRTVAEIQVPLGPAGGSESAPAP